MTRSSSADLDARGRRRSSRSRSRAASSVTRPEADRNGTPGSLPQVRGAVEVAGVGAGVGRAAVTAGVELEDPRAAGAGRLGLRVQLAGRTRLPGRLRGRPPGSPGRGTPTAREGPGRRRERGTAAGRRPRASGRAALPSATSADAARSASAASASGKMRGAEFADRHRPPHGLVDQEAHRRIAASAAYQQVARGGPWAGRDAAVLQEPADGAEAGGSRSRRRRTPAAARRRALRRPERSPGAAGDRSASRPSTLRKSSTSLPDSWPRTRGRTRGWRSWRWWQMTCSRSAVIPRRDRSRRSSSATSAPAAPRYRCASSTIRRNFSCRVRLQPRPGSCRRPAVPAGASACTRASSSS